MISRRFTCCSREREDSQSIADQGMTAACERLSGVIEWLLRRAVASVVAATDRVCVLESAVTHARWRLPEAYGVIIPCGAQNHTALGTRHGVLNAQGSECGVEEVTACLSDEWEKVAGTKPLFGRFDKLA